MSISNWFLHRSTPPPIPPRLNDEEIRNIMLQNGMPLHWKNNWILLDNYDGDVDDECCICIGKLKNDEGKNFIKHKECKNVFHRTCIFDGVIKNNSILCPLCRRYFGTRKRSIKKYKKKSFKKRSKKRSKKWSKKVL
jgi:hypothetical protein